MLGQAVNWDYQWGQIVGRAWADADFKRRLVTEPARVLADYDLTFPVGQRVEVIEDRTLPPANEGVTYLVLPARPSAEDLSEDDLCSGGAVAAEYCHDYCRCACHHCEWCRGCYVPPRPEDN